MIRQSGLQKLRDHHRKVSALPEIGAVMEDGSLFAGLSPDNGRKLFVAAEDAKRRMTFREAEKYTETFNEQKPHGRDDWRLPTRGELKLLFDNMTAGALKGTFKDEAHPIPKTWYWTSEPKDPQSIFAWSRHTADGQETMSSMASSARYVRQDKNI